MQIADEIQKLKYKEPTSTKIPILEQELVRAEAQNLVAEAQLTNISRQKLKEAYDIHTAAVIERAEKQILLAKNARKVLNLLDDTPVVPGDVHPAFDRGEEARELLNVAEEDLRRWQPDYEPIHSSAGNLQANAMPDSSIETNAYSSSAPVGTSTSTVPASTFEEESIHHAHNHHTLDEEPVSTYTESRTLA